MDCRAYCTAASYRIKPFYEIIRQRLKATYYRDAVHLEVPLTGLPNGNIFYFSFGAVVCWGLPKENEMQMIQAHATF